MLRRTDLAGQLGARGEVGDGQRRTAIGTLDAEKRPVVGGVAHALHDEPVVLGREPAFARLENELQVIEIEEAQAVQLNGHPLDAHLRQPPPPLLLLSGC